MENQINPLTPNDNGKTIAIISYMTLIGWIVALVMHGNTKTTLGAFHLRQMLGLLIIGIGSMIIRIPLMFIPFIGSITNLAFTLVLVALWIIGLIAAINAEEKPIPVIGPLFQNWFASIGK